MDYLYIGSAQSVAKSLLLTGAVSAAIALIAMCIHVSRRRSPSLLIIATISVAVGIWQGLRYKSLVRIDGEWQIIVDKDGIEWRSPDESIEASFTISFAQILSVRITEFPDKPASKFRYILLTSNGDKPLSPLSGVDLAAFSETLEALGVSVIRNVEHSARK